MKIADLVTLDDKAEFRSDVQLSYYDSPEKNLALLHSYLFSSAVPRRGVTATKDVSAIHILSILKDIYLNDSINRMALIANYGHGKSHLALALANYFGRAADSEECQIIYPKIEAAIDDPAESIIYREFKKHRGEFLLIRLQGDVPQSLHAQFLSGLERGLAEHDATRDAKLPFWHERALHYLTNLTPAQMEKANAYLARYQRDVPLLCQDITANHDVFDEAVATIEAATGIRPDLSEVGLAEALNWAIENFVDTGKLGGVLILFDEFTLYVERYGHRTAPAELQDLLNGVDKLRGKAAFLAFAQADPDTTAEHLHSLNPDARTSLKKALTRIERKYQLSTVMESVIDAYLKQDPRRWNEFIKSQYVRGPLQHATDVTLIHFRNRYENTLRWGQQTFEDTITKGSFPLHPITTYLLCNMPLGTASDVGTTRTMLGFVRDQLEEKEPQPALVNNRPNWILPIELINYFEGRFPGDSYRAYQAALDVVGAEITPEQVAVLKALLLQQLAGVKSRLADDQREFLAQAAGLSDDETRTILRKLAEMNAIMWNPVAKNYTLFPAAANNNRLESILKQKIESMPFDSVALKELNDWMASGKVPGLSFGSRPISVSWGHEEDWKAVEQILTVDNFSAKHFSEIVNATYFGPRGELIEGARSYVFWLLARTDEELAQLRNEAQIILDQAFPSDSPIPVVLILPDSPQPNLIAAFQRRRALNKLSHSEKEGISPEMLRHVEQQANADILKAMNALRGHEQPFDLPRDATRCVVPKLYRSKIRALQRAKLSTIIGECYDLAYPFRPPEFDKRYPATGQRGSKFKIQVTKIAAQLLRNRSRSLPEVAVGGDASMMRDIYTRYLLRAWGLLSEDYSIRVPNTPGLRRAWEYLDAKFPPGGAESLLSEALTGLLNTPYGFDYNTALLLFAAWVGHNYSDVRISQAGRMVKVDVFDSALTKSGKDFLKFIHENRIQLTRRDLNDVERDIREKLASYAHRSHEPDEARALIDMFRDLAQDKRADVNLREQVMIAADQLQEALEAAAKYDSDAAAINRAMESADLSKLLDFRQKVSQMHSVTLVKTVAPPLTEIQQAIDEAIQATVQRSVKEYGTLHDINAYEWNRKHLIKDRRLLQEAGLTKMADMIDRALDELKNQEQVLRIQQHEKPIRDMLNNVRIDSPLAVLYEQREQLSQLTGYSDATMKLQREVLEKISAEIARLESDANALRTRVLLHNDQKALRNELEYLMKVSYRYKETPFAQVLELAKVLIDQYATFLVKISEMNKAIQNLGSPEEVEQIQASLEQMENKNKEWMEENQKQLLENTRNKLAEQVNYKCTEATKWFHRITQISRQSNSNPVELWEEIQDAPVFLSQEQKAQLHQLKYRIQQQIDQNIVSQIEREFRKIQDLQTRRECVARLQLLIDEQPTERVGNMVHH